MQATKEKPMMKITGGDEGNRGGGGDRVRMASKTVSVA